MRLKRTEKTNWIIDRLPGDLKRVAELIGIEATMILVNHYGGSYLLIPKCEGILREVRNDEIRKLYDTGKFTARELAWKFKLTDRTVYTILSEESGADMPLPLLDLLKKSDK